MSVTVYDDRNALIVYSSSPGWTRGGNVSDVDGTSTWSTSAGASFTFKFTGVSISVFGTLSGTSAAPQSAYSIDGGEVQMFTAVTPTGVQFTFHQLFFSRSGLTAGVTHTLVVTNLVENTWYFLDSIQVEAASPTTITTTTTAVLPVTTSSSTVSTTSTITAATTPTTTSTTSRTSTTSSQTSSFTSTTGTSSTGAIATSAAGGTVVTVTTGGSSVILAPTASPDSVNSKSSVSTGPIIGGVLGGIIVLLLIIAALLFLRWRRNRAARPESLVVHPMMTSATDDAPSRMDSELAPGSPPSADYQPHSKFQPYQFSPTNFSSPSEASASDYREGSVFTTPSSPHGYDRIEANHLPPPKYERYEDS